MSSPSTEPVVPSAKDGLHCGVRNFPPDLSAWLVVPSAKDGLHCGTDDSAELVYEVNVVPSAKDGLHCGDGRFRTSRKLSMVVPSAKDGLHCGVQVGENMFQQHPSRPVRQGRAPLRRHCLPPGRT